MPTRIPLSAVYPLPKRAASEPERFAYIDAVRGLAFLAVLCAHIAMSVNVPGRVILMGGMFGVQLFFLASAITLCYSMDARSQVEARPVLSFYLRRLFRIAPLFWLAMLFYLLFPSVMPAFWLGQWAPFGVRASYYWMTAFFLHGWNAYSFNSIVPGGWSIAVEMNFYLIFPILYKYLGKSLRLAGVALLVGTVSLRILLHFTTRPLFGVDPTVWLTFSHYWLPAQLPVFLTGFFTYPLTRDAGLKRRLRSPWTAGCLFVLSLLFAISAIHGARVVFIPHMIAMSASLALLIVSLSAGSLRLIVNKATTYVGKISYSCYLVHFAALGLPLRMFGIHPTELTPWDAGSGSKNGVMFVATFLTSGLLTVMFATFTYRFIERPGIALGRRVIRSLNAGMRVSQPKMGAPGPSLLGSGD